MTKKTMQSDTPPVHHNSQPPPPPPPLHHQQQSTFSPSSPTPPHQPNSTTAFTTASSEQLQQLKQQADPYSQRQLHRQADPSDSLRSSLSDLSEARRVSFNADVQINKISPHHKSKLINSRQQQQQLLTAGDVELCGPFARVTKEDPPVSEAEIASEAQLILRQLAGIQCSVSSSAAEAAGAAKTAVSKDTQVRNTSSLSRPTHQHSSLSSKFDLLNQGNSNTSSLTTTDSGNSSGGASSNAASPPHHNTLDSSVQQLILANEERDGRLQEEQRLHHIQRQLLTQNHNSDTDTTLGGGGGRVSRSNQDNHLYGLHALNNLDIAVNGKNVNSMPSYQEVRRSQNLDSSGGSAEYSPPLNRNNLISPPTKPPRSKAPSSSPPTFRRNRNMAATQQQHYAQPERSSQMVSSMMEQLDSRFRRRMPDTTEDDDMSSAITSSYSSRAQPHQQQEYHHHIHRSNNAASPPPPRHHSMSPSRLSPSRTCMTDTELLRSPAEVLYAVSDKHKHHNNERVAHSASQTTQSELQQQQHRASSTYSYEPVTHKISMSRQQSHNNRANSSRDDLLKYNNGRPSSRQQSHHHPGSNNHHRSLERFADHEDKENAFKARIHVTSPDRMSPERASSSMHNRKPYKTTICTATDNIQYRGITRPASSASVQNGGSNRYQKNQQLYKRQVDNEHYKVPKNKAPVEYLRNGSIRPMHTDSDHSSSVYHYNNGQPHQQPRSQFASTRLVKNVESRRSNGTSRELDREGRTIRRSAGEGRGRTYSGCSTSPDREGSPDRYARPKPPVRSYSSLHRSPSTSPTRPPRSRSSPGREIISNVVRRVTSRRDVERTPSTRAVATSRSPIKDIKRVHNDIRRGNSGDRHRIVSQKNSYDDSEERLARFTEYRGDGNGNGDEGMDTDRASSRAGTVTMDHRRGSSGYDIQRRRRSEDQSADESGRERGRSLPPGANIDSMRDFYKSSQFKSMYALPPSPNRPAPVLDRAPSASTLIRRERSRDHITVNNPNVAGGGRPPVRPNRVSISEGEITDDPARQERIIRHRNKFLSSQHQQQQQQGIVKKPSTKRQAPSPPGVLRRVVSSDREDQSRQARINVDQIRRVQSSDRGLQHPPQRRPIVVGRKTSMGEPLDSSYSESEGFNGDPEQVRPPLICNTLTKNKPFFALIPFVPSPKSIKHLLCLSKLFFTTLFIQSRRN